MDKCDGVIRIASGVLPYSTRQSANANMYEISSQSNSSGEFFDAIITTLVGTSSASKTGLAEGRPFIVIVVTNKIVLTNVHSIYKEFFELLLGDESNHTLFIETPYNILRDFSTAIHSKTAISAFVTWK